VAEFYHDNQIRRYLIQFAKIFSNWYCTKGLDPNGNPILVRVPIIYGNSSRQAATIIANNSANNLPCAPLFSYYVSGLEYNQRWTTEPYFVDKMHVRQRELNTQTGQFNTTQGQAFTIERLMPVPYILRVTVDFWSTNEQQKLEIIEQIGAIFNPALELQSTDNYIDWTSLTAVFQDGINYSSRTIPQGTTNSIDILTWKFYMPIWITAPAKLKKMGVIHKVIANIFEGSSLYDIKDDDLILGTRQKITPWGYKLLLSGNQLQILPHNSVFNPSNSDPNIPIPPDTNIYWSSLLNVYGNIRPGISQIWIQNEYLENEIVGTIALNPLDDRFLIFNIDIDTLPPDTLPPINGIIDPAKVGPGVGLPSATAGTRYLIISNIGYPGAPTVAWGNLIANANDIIEYDGTNWNVAFDSEEAAQDELVTNNYSNIQFRYVSKEKIWIKSYEGFIDQGDWSIVI
jgi:hypothetical protein